MVLGLLKTRTWQSESTQRWSGCRHWTLSSTMRNGRYEHAWPRALQMEQLSLR